MTKPFLKDVYDWHMNEADKARVEHKGKKARKHFNMAFAILRTLETLQNLDRKEEAS